MRTRFKLVGSGANEVKIMVQLSCVRPGLTLTPSGLNIFTLLGPYFLMQLCISVSFPPSESGRAVSESVLIDFEAVAVGNAARC